MQYIDPLKETLEEEGEEEEGEEEEEEESGMAEE